MLTIPLHISLVQGLFTPSSQETDRVYSTAPAVIYKPTGTVDYQGKFFYH